MGLKRSLKAGMHPERFSLLVGTFLATVDIAQLMWLGLRCCFLEQTITVSTVGPSVKRVAVPGPPLTFPLFAGHWDGHEGSFRNIWIFISSNL